jgi:hypothetical protein
LDKGRPSGANGLRGWRCALGLRLRLRLRLPAAISPDNYRRFALSQPHSHSADSGKPAG